VTDEQPPFWHITARPHHGTATYLGHAETETAARAIADEWAGALCAIIRWGAGTQPDGTTIGVVEHVDVSNAGIVLLVPRGGHMPPATQQLDPKPTPGRPDGPALLAALTAERAAVDAWISDANDGFGSDAGDLMFALEKARSGNAPVDDQAAADVEDPLSEPAPRTTCGDPCPRHEHACARSVGHGWPHRDVKQKGHERCSWPF